MNLEDVSRYIQQPSQLTLSDAEALKSMSEKHPYAAVFSLLYLTALANGKSIDLDQALQQHAYRLNDRTQLYYLLHPETSELEEKDEAIVPEPVVSIAPLTEEPVVETSAETVEIRPEVDTPTTVVEEEPITEIPDTFSLETEAFTLEQTYIPEPLESEEQEPESAESVEITETHDHPATEEKAEPTIEPATTSIIPEKGEKRSFTSWLKSNHSEPQPKEPSSIPAEDKPRAADLIDRFIAEEPTISRPKNEFFSPPKKAKESLDENAIPVSETLAKIYAAQGNYPKAIHVYHQLMLLNPEKKLLFAVRIEELKKKITT